MLFGLPGSKTAVPSNRNGRSRCMPVQALASISPSRLLLSRRQPRTPAPRAIRQQDSGVRNQGGVRKYADSWFLTPGIWFLEFDSSNFSDNQCCKQRERTNGRYQWDLAFFERRIESVPVNRLTEYFRNPLREPLE